MSNYELNCLVTPNISQEELQKLQDTIEKTVQEDGGGIVSVKNPLKRSLPHRIKNFDMAYFISLVFMSSPETIKKLEAKLKEDSLILRYFVLNKGLKLAEEGKSKKLGSKKQEKVALEKFDEKLNEILENV